MMNSTVHDDDYYDAGGCDNDGCIMFDIITAADDDGDNGGIGCDNGGWH